MLETLTFIAVWIALLGTIAWALSFWPRWIAADAGVPVSTVLDPRHAAWRPIAQRLPLISFAFWRWLWREKRMIEFTLAMIAVIMISRAASAFFKTAAAVAKTQG